MMTITVGITQVQDAFGIYYARQLAGAVLAGLPVALAYLLFQRRVTEAITLSAGYQGLRRPEISKSETVAAMATPVRSRLEPL